jgi:hypothetical protein
MRISHDAVWVAEVDGYHIREKRDMPGSYRGWITTKMGIVAIEQWVWANREIRDRTSISIEFVHRGFYMRRWLTRKEPCSKRYLVTLARRFAEEIVYGKKPKG